MTMWAIEPRDGLVVRDGRPNQGRSQSAGRPFPLPSTIAGALRTRLGLGADGVFSRSPAEAAALRGVGIRGPWLVEVDSGVFYAPCPQDLVVYENGDDRRIAAAAPGPKVVGALMDASPGAALAPITAAAPAGFGGKPSEGPAFLRWDRLLEWLLRAGARDAAETQRMFDGAIDELPEERRTHLQVGQHGTAEEGMLFEVTALRLVHPRTRAALALAVEVDDEEAARVGALREGLAPLGGRRRLVRWRRASWALPSVPAEVQQAIGKGERSCVRVLLMTPALFEEGWRPSLAEGAPLGPRRGMTVRLMAASVGRPLAISGWDFALRQPKRTRRAAPAGTVLWLELVGAAEARRAWLEAVWGKAVSDDAQDRRDGFGLAVVGLADRR